MGKRRKKKRARARKGDVVTTPTGAWRGWCNGACRGNPVAAGIGGVVKDVDGMAIAVFSEAIGYASNNEAEWRALNRLIELAGVCAAPALMVRSDSELVVRQFQGVYEARKPALALQRAKAMKAAKRLPGGVVVAWTARAGNAEADALAGRAVAMPQMPTGSGGHVAAPWPETEARQLDEWPDHSGRRHAAPRR